MMTSGLLRRRFTPKLIKELDAFPKVPESYKETTASGGTISIISFIVIIFLVVFEIRYYSTSRFRFLYTVDTDYDSVFQENGSTGESSLIMNREHRNWTLITNYDVKHTFSKLRINIDVTVAMPCETIGADVLDVTNQNSRIFGSLEEEPAYFELTPIQKIHWESVQRVNMYIREQFHSIQDVLWREKYLYSTSLPPRDTAPLGEPDACRLFGSLVVNKVSGNFHITAGKHIPLPAGHAHVSVLLRERDYNFSHRVERFSFGPVIPGIVNPLEGEEKITDSNFHLFQYYLKVVSTDVDTSTDRVNTYQYAVTEQNRTINHDAGSHGVPGIYFKYDMSAVKVKVKEDYVTIWQFLIRLCGIIGGVYATSGVFDFLVKFVTDIVTCQYVEKSISVTATNPCNRTHLTLLNPDSPPSTLLEPASEVGFQLNGHFGFPVSNDKPKAFPS